MSDIVCTSCTVTVPQEKEVASAFRVASGEEVQLSELTAAWAKTGLPPQVLMGYLNDGVSHPALPEYSFQVVKKLVDTEVEKCFDGTEEEAEAANWVQNEFGWCCADCSGVAYETEDGTATGEGENLATQVAVLAAVGFDRIAKLAGTRAVRNALTDLVLLEAEDQGMEVVDE